MTKLSAEIQREIDELSDKSNDTYDNGDYIKTIELLEQAWNKLPNPKFMYDDSYHIARSIALISLKLDKFEQAKEWAEITKLCDPERQDIGEKEFLLGQVAYESGQLTEAKKYLKIADFKSGGRCFRGQNKKYQQVLR